jgi:hypothetical protein
MDISIFCAIMELWVSGNGDGGLIVDMEDGEGEYVLAKFQQKLPQPYSFFSGVSPGDIFHLSA